ncbi:MAG TPA: AtpZ/AtpI family protein [Thermodesulfatator atlanticus]|uniref:AtpZ/AtpI family protein n=1 Tax=Thermodesulfatator atlanticus TaxID=501497 RepID=A0A7V5P047_9BACT|nr:AtpZ/AtpI family protein [Thermodesulfatator atlanticus]
MRENLRYFFVLLADFLTIGIAAGGSVAAGLLTGWFIDEKVFHGRTSPWFTVIFAAFGIAGGIKNVFLLSRKMRSRENKKKK